MAFFAGKSNKAWVGIFVSPFLSKDCQPRGSWSRWQTSGNANSHVDLDYVLYLVSLSMSATAFVCLVFPKNVSKRSPDGSDGQVQAGTDTHVGLDEIGHIQFFTSSINILFEFSKKILIFTFIYLEIPCKENSRQISGNKCME